VIVSEIINLQACVVVTTGVVVGVGVVVTGSGNGDSVISKIVVVSVFELSKSKSNKKYIKMNNSLK